MQALTCWSSRAVTALHTNFRIMANANPMAYFQTRHNCKKRLKVRKFKRTEIPVEMYKQDFSEPISGSVIFPNIAEIRDKEFASDIESLKSRGFLRFQKAYNPPEDLEQRFSDVVMKILPVSKELKGANFLDYSLADSKVKYQLLAALGSEFQHQVPNSLLPSMLRLGNVFKFYSTEVDMKTPYDELRLRSDLPPNLHVQKEPVRFTQETSQYFNELTAFPKSSTIVTGLRAKQKYEGYKAKKIHI